MLDFRTQWGRPGQVAPHYDISTSNSTKNQITNPQMVYTKPCFFRANKIIEHLPTCNDSSTMLPSATVTSFAAAPYWSLQTS